MRSAVAAMFFCGATALWLSLDRAPPQWDDSFYLTNSLRMYDSLVDGGLAGYARQFFTILGFKAPLITVLPTPFYLLFTRDWRIAYAVNVVAMLALFAAVMAIAKHYATERAAFIAVFIAATMPLLYGLSRWYLTEYALAAMVTGAVWLLIRSKDLLFGVVSGLGLLLKVNYPVFVMVPAAVTLWRTRKLQPLLRIMVPCLAIAAPWYLLNWRRTFANVIDAGFGYSATSQTTGDVFSLQAIATYLDRVARHGVSFYWLIAGIAAIAILAWRRDRATLLRVASVLSWAAPFVIYVFGVNKDIRYIAPLLPFVAIAFAIALDKAIAARGWLLVPLLAIPLLHFSTTSFGWPYRSPVIGYARLYQTDRWPHDEILDAIRQSTVFSQGERKRLLIGTDRAYFNADNFDLAVLQKRLPLRVETTAYEKNLDALLRNVSSADFFLYKDGGEPESSFFNRHFKEVIAHVRNTPEMVEMPFAAVLPDGGVARVFGKSTGVELPAFNAAFRDLLELTAMSVTQRKNSIEIRCQWRCMRALDREYWTFAHLVDGAGAIVSQADYPIARTVKPGDTWMEERSLTMRSSNLRIRLGVYNPPTGERLSVTRVPASATPTEDGTGLWINIRK